MLPSEIAEFLQLLVRNVGLDFEADRDLLESVTDCRIDTEITDQRIMSPLL